MDSVVVNLTETSKGDIIEQTQVYFLSHSHNPVGSPSIRLVRDQGGEIRTFFFFFNFESVTKNFLSENL